MWWLNLWGWTGSLTMSLLLVGCCSELVKLGSWKPRAVGVGWWGDWWGLSWLWFWRGLRRGWPVCWLVLTRRAPDAVMSFTLPIVSGAVQVHLWLRGCSTRPSCSSCSCWYQMGLELSGWATPWLVSSVWSRQWLLLLPVLLQNLAFQTDPTAFALSSYFLISDLSYHLFVLPPREGRLGTSEDRKTWRVLYKNCVPFPIHSQPVSQSFVKIGSLFDLCN